MLEQAHFLFSFEFSFHLLQGSKAAVKVEADSTTNKIEKIKENAGSSKVETVRKKIASLSTEIMILLRRERNRMTWMLSRRTKKLVLAC